MFIPATCHINRPLLLIVDGHAAHVNLNVVHLLKENQIVCLMLPPHSTHCLQPIDVVLFNNVKTDWTNIVKNHMKTGNQSVKNTDVPGLMKKLFLDKQSFSTTRIVSSFARSGRFDNINIQSFTNRVLLSVFEICCYFLLYASRT